MKNEEELKQKVSIITENLHFERIGLNMAVKQLRQLFAQSPVAKPKPVPEEIREFLIKTFAQTVEYGAMCSECCSSQGEGDKVLCEMSDKPLKTDDYCPQQIACIDNILPALATHFRKGYVKEK